MSEEIVLQEQQVTISLGANVNEVTRRRAIIKDVFSRIMQEGIHYGTIPGIASKKPSLWKAGAEELASAFNLSVDPKEEEKLLPDGHREYLVRTRITQNGRFVGTGLGSCTTMESKYRYRKYEGRREENTDIADLYNTVLKMAKKRSVVDAILTATGASDIFTQDLEDLADNESHHHEVKAPAFKTTKQVEVVEGIQVWDVSVKSTKQEKFPDGKPYYIIEFADGRKAGTVNKDLYEAAALTNEDEKYKVEVRPSRKPGNFILQKLDPVG